MIQILCICVKTAQYTIIYYLEKCDITPQGPSNKPTKFRVNRPPLTLSNRCSNFIFFANFLIDTCGALDQDCVYQLSC